jgi:two-component system sensor histidine kinase and response regulator WspE
VKAGELPLASIGLTVNFFSTLGHQSVEELTALTDQLSTIGAMHIEIIENLPKAPPEPVPAEPPVVIDTSLPDLSDFSMLELFKLEVETQVHILNTGILQLERDMENKEEIDTLMRAAHSIKGAARIVQIEAAVQLAHSMEDCFISAKEGKISLTNHHLDILFTCTDLLAEIGKRLSPQDPYALDALRPQITEMVNSLQQISQSHTPVPVVASPAILDRADVSPPRQSEVPSENSERVVRVSKENLNRLMGLAGESLVSANWLQPFADSLLKLKHKQTELSRLLEQLSDHYTQKRVLSDYELNFLRTAIHKAELCRQILSDRLNELEVFARQSANLSDRLYRAVIASHMRPFADGIQAFPRMVRDVAKKLNKQAQLEIAGKSTQVDRDILEKLEAPLTHILRNAIDHGIETP